MSIRNLDSLFRPASVAVIGASDRARSLGAAVIHNLLNGGFDGPLWPVNLGHRTVAGRRAYRHVCDLPSPPQLGVICTPPETVPGIISELGHIGTRAAVVFPDGLARQTAADGRSLTASMLDAARPYLLRILGPNSVGLLVSGRKLNASLAAAQALTGNVALVSQSGAIATAMLDWARRQGVGFSHFVSLGDSADVDVGDVLDYLANDSAARAILLYLESVSAARKFMSAARAAARSKPVIAVKAGRVLQESSATISHTGPLAVQDGVYEAALSRAGIVRVDTTQELFDAAETLARAGPLAGNRLAIMTNGRGPGVMATDFLVSRGGRLAILPEKTLHALDAALPAGWPRINPVALAANAPAECYVAALRALLDNPDCDAVLFIHAPTAAASSTEIAKACIPLIQSSARNVFVCWMGGEMVMEADTLFSQAGAPTYASPEDAVRGFLQMDRYRRVQELLLEAPPSIEDFVPYTAAARAVIDAALSQGRSTPSEAEAKRVLEAYGIPTAKRSEPAGGMGFMIQGVTDALLLNEVVVGIVSDSVFGPLVFLGEKCPSMRLTPNTAVALPPLDWRLARELISRSAVPKVLDGDDGGPSADGVALQLTLVRMSQLAIDLPQVETLVISFPLAGPIGGVAFDVKMQVRLDRELGPDRLVIRPYPSELEEKVSLAGRPILMRPVRPEDEPQHREFLARIEPVDMQFRFFCIKREFSRSELARLTQIDYDREMAFIAAADNDDGVRETLGVARAIFDADNAVAEFALLVRSDCQGKGLGRTLLMKLIRYCRARGTKSFVGVVLTSNSRMLSLCASVGLEIAYVPGEPGVATVSIALNPEHNADEGSRVLSG